MKKKLTKEEKLYKEFEQWIVKYPYSDTEELNDEHENIFKWVLKVINRESMEAVEEYKTNIRQQI